MSEFTLIITCYSKSRDHKSSSTSIESGKLRHVDDLYLHRNNIVSRLESSLLQLKSEDHSQPKLSKPHLMDQADGRVLSIRFSCLGTWPPAELIKLRHSDSITALQAMYNMELVWDLVPLTATSGGSTSAATAGFPRCIKLALFDMDSTLIDQEVIDELARSIGKTKEVSAITELAMNGEIDFATSLAQRVAMLEGVRSDVWIELRKSVTVSSGAREFVQRLRENGVITGVISGGFMPMAEWLKGELGLDYAFANQLATSPPSENFAFEHLTGVLQPGEPVIVPEYKRDTLIRLREKHGLARHETMAIGDGSNDLLMLAEAGLGVAWKAKQTVQLRAPNRLNGNSMDDLRFLLV